MRYKTLLLTLIILLISFMSVSAEEVHYYNATGGVVTYYQNYTIHTFNSNGTFNVTGVLRNPSVLIVAGGGGGGSGGGGAGGLIYNTTYNITTTLFTITVGYGGAGGTNASVNGTDGGNSTFGVLTSIGGGGGAKQDNVPGRIGGSGGGASIASGASDILGGAGITGQGNPGGNTTNHDNPYCSAGGGGAGNPGSDCHFVGQGGSGGPGIQTISINGSTVCYAAGGAGGYHNSGAGGTPGNSTCGILPRSGGNSSRADAPIRLATGGLNNTGSGGGAGDSTPHAGGRGGDGVIIIRYLTDTIIMRSSTINPANLFITDNINAYCLADSTNGTINYNYTLYMNGAINSSGTVTGFGSGVSASVVNVSSSYLAVGQQYILNCLAYNDGGVSNSMNSSTSTVASLKINVTIYDESNNSLLLENVSIDSSSITESHSNSTTTGRTTIGLTNSGLYTVVFSSAAYATRTYQMQVYGNETSGAVLDVRLLRMVNASNFTIYIQDSLNRVVPNTRLIISRAYVGNWTTVVDTYADDGGRAILSLQSGTSYVVTIIADGFPVKQFVQVFWVSGNPYTFRLTSGGGVIYTDVFNGINYSYGPTNTLIEDDSGLGNETVFWINVISLTDNLQWVSVYNSDLGISTNVTGPTVANASSAITMAPYAGQSFTITYCLEDTNYEQYCFDVTYYVQGSAGSNPNNLINTLRGFKDLFTGGTSAGWLTIIAIFGVLIICVITAQLSGNPVVTTISGFSGMIIFTYLGWLNPILTGFVCVIGLLLFFFNKQGGS
jgi:hypothetical protein